jgi:hypothetical protein
MGKNLHDLLIIARNAAFLLKCGISRLIESHKVMLDMGILGA